MELPKGSGKELPEIIEAQSMRELMKQNFINAYIQCKGEPMEIMAKLKVSRSSVYRKIKEYGLPRIWENK
jgi:transcriptional regulator of acetoin/glycerol metabolism